MAKKINEYGKLGLLQALEQRVFRFILVWLKPILRFYGIGNKLFGIQHRIGKKAKPKTTSSQIQGVSQKRTYL